MCLVHIFQAKNGVCEEGRQTKGSKVASPIRMVYCDLGERPACGATTRAALAHDHRPGTQRCHRLDARQSDYALWGPGLAPGTRGPGIHSTTGKPADPREVHTRVCVRMCVRVVGERGG